MVDVIVACENVIAHRFIQRRFCHIWGLI